MYCKKKNGRTSKRLSSPHTSYLPPYQSVRNIYPVLMFNKEEYFTMYLMDAVENDAEYFFCVIFGL